MEDGTNLGVISLREALDKARETGLDLIEISPKANPPVAKIMDYGKFQYAENNKEKIDKIKDLLNNNGSRNVFLTESEFRKFNKHGTRTGWKKYKNWYYRTGVDATSLSNFIKIIEQKINIEIYKYEKNKNNCV